MILRLAIVTFALLFSAPVAAEPIPGDSCAGKPEGAFMQSGGPELGGNVYFLTCVSGVWEAASVDSSCPASGLVGHWKLDESSGTTATDSAGSNDGTLNGGPVWQPSGGKIGGALSFDGTDDYVALPSVLTNFGASDWSFAVWIYHSNYNGSDTYSSQQPICSSSNPAASSAPPEPRMELTLRDGQYWHRYLGADDEYVVGAQMAGEWVHLVAVFSGRDLILYKNGSRTQTKTMTADRAALNDTTLYIGNAYGMGEFPGLMDDFRIYNRALTAEEASGLYKGGAGCP